MDAPSTVFDLQADGADRSILVTGLTDDPAPGPDAVTLKAMSALIARLRTIVADADYQSDRVEAVLAEVEAGPGIAFAAWPWPDLAPADFPQPPDDAAIPFPSRVLTAAEAERVERPHGRQGGARPRAWSRRPRLRAGAPPRPARGDRGRPLTGDGRPGQSGQAGQPPARRVATASVDR